MWRKCIPGGRNSKCKGPVVGMTSDVVKEQESKPKRWEQEGGKQASQTRSCGVAALVRSLRVFLSMTETPWRVLSRGMAWHDMTWLILQCLSCYMENEFRIWKLIKKRLWGEKEQRYLPLVPTYFSFMVLLFSTLTSVDILGGRTPVTLVLFHLPSLYPGSERSLYITRLIGVPRHLNMCLKGQLRTLLI